MTATSLTHASCEEVQKCIDNTINTGNKIILIIQKQLLSSSRLWCCPGRRASTLSIPTYFSFVFRLPLDIVHLVKLHVVNGQLSSGNTHTSSGATRGCDLELVQPLEVSFSTKVDECRTIAGIPQGGLIAANAVSTFVEAFNKNIQALPPPSSSLESSN